MEARVFDARQTFGRLKMDPTAIRHVNAYHASATVRAVVMISIALLVRLCVEQEPTLAHSG